MSGVILRGGEGRANSLSREIRVLKNPENACKFKLRALNSCRGGMRMERQIPVGIRGALTSRKEFGPYPRGSRSLGCLTSRAGTGQLGFLYMVHGE